MTWAEVERSIAAGGSEDLWDSLYLTSPEITALLQYVKEHATYPFVCPMFCFAAYSGARRSEMLRAQNIDLDWQGNYVIIREKKRARGKRTTRRVPMTPLLRQVMEEWMKAHPGGQHLFCLPAVVDRSRKRSLTTGHKGEKTRKSGEKPANEP